MKIPNSCIVAVLLVSALFLSGCVEDDKKQQEYQKCTSVCAAVVEGSTEEETLVTLEICREECRKQFLE